MRNRANVAVLVSGGGTNLQALIDANMDFATIKLVVSNKAGAYALERAKNAGIKGFTLAKDNFEKNLIELLKEYEIDVIVLAGFLRVLSADFVKQYPNRIINVHPSLIPSFCGDGFYGLTVHEKALEYGVKVTGATVHFVNEITDGGKIILQKAVYIQENDTPETLQKRVMEQAEWVLLPKACEMVCEDILKKENRE